MPADADRATTYRVVIRRVATRSVASRSVASRPSRTERLTRCPAAAFLAPHHALAILIAFACALAPHVVQADDVVVIGSGDTLSGIAAANGTTVAAIVERNGLPSADVIYLGQRLLVPGDAAAPDGPGTDDHRILDGAPGAPGAIGAIGALGSTGATAATDGGDVAHTVAPGESLFAIAIAYRATVREIVVANGLGRADFVYAGQRLRIPNAHRREQSADAVASGAAADGVGAGRSDDDAAGVANEDGANGAAANAGGSRRIVIDLSDQTLSAFAGARRVNRFIVSSGSAWTPTPLGTYAVYSRTVSQRMVGPGYDLPGVPFVQYFTGSYAIHGAYWHQSFGVPISHGCVNLQPGDAAWLWDWADVGTPVIVQP